LAPFFKLEVEGTRHLPRESAFILLPKHQRWEDIPLLGLASPRPLYYVAKYELFANPLSDWFFKSLGGIPLNRQQPIASRRYLNDTIRMLKKGEGVVVFPEGTYFRGRMGPGRTGLVRFIVSRLSLPFIPAGVRYSGNRRRASVKIRFGAPVTFDHGGDPDRLLKALMERIADLSGLAT
jgi:1-acyl-sn-glycerol-3-phosphate acyltransferase